MDPRSDIRWNSAAWSEEVNLKCLYGTNDVFALGF